MVTVSAPGLPGERAVIVFLPGEPPVLEEGPVGLDPVPLAASLRLARPFRAVAQRRHGDVWAVGARRLETVILDPDPGGEEILVVWDGTERAVTIDGVPALAVLPELGWARGGVVGPYAATLRRLEGPCWEIERAAI